MGEDRINPIPPKDLSGAHKDAHNYIHSAIRAAFGEDMDKIFQVHDEQGAFIGPVAMCVKYPDLAKPYMDLLGAISKLAKLTPEVRETVILTVGGVYQARYEIYAHERLALATTSLRKEQVSTMKEGKKPSDLTEECALAWDISHALASQKGPLAQETWGAGVRVMGQDAVMSIVNYAGYYAYTCIILNAVNAGVPPDEEQTVSGK